MNALDYASEAGNILVLPDTVIKIKQLIDDGASMQEVAEVINYDPALMSRVLKISNSALYKFPSKISNITKAVQVIGTKAVYDLVLAYGVANAVKDVDTNVIDLDRFWQQSVSCALLARYFAEEISHKEPERLFVCGLLHNIGELVVAQISPQIAKKCERVSEAHSPLALQKKYLGFTYAEVGAKLLRWWGIPATISGPINKQHRALTPAETQDDKLMQLAYILAISQLGDEHEPIEGSIDKEFYQPLGIDIDSLERAITFTHSQMMSMLALFNPASFSVL